MGPNRVWQYFSQKLVDVEHVCVAHHEWFSTAKNESNVARSIRNIGKQTQPFEKFVAYQRPRSQGWTIRSTSFHRTEQMRYKKSSSVYNVRAPILDILTLALLWFRVEAVGANLWSPSAAPSWLSWSFYQKNLKVGTGTHREAEIPQSKNIRAAWSRQPPASQRHARRCHLIV